MYPLLKQEATKNAGQLEGVLIVVYEIILYCMIVNLGINADTFTTYIDTYVHSYVALVHLAQLS